MFGRRGAACCARLIEYLRSRVTKTKKPGKPGFSSFKRYPNQASIAIFSFFMAFFSNWRTRSAETPY
jgi:hypothetical protein